MYENLLFNDIGNVSGIPLNYLLKQNHDRFKNFVIPVGLILHNISATVSDIETSCTDVINDDIFDKLLNNVSISIKKKKNNTKKLLVNKKKLLLDKK
jgi:hypothetical protein